MSEDFERHHAPVELMNRLKQYAREESPQYEEELVAGMSVSRSFMIPIDTRAHVQLDDDAELDESEDAISWDEGDVAHISLDGGAEIDGSEQEWISIELGLSAMRGMLFSDEDDGKESMPYEEFAVWINSTRTVKLGDPMIPDGAIREMSESITVGDPNELSEGASIDEIRAKFCEEMGDETTLTHCLNRTYAISDRSVPDIRIHESNLYTFDEGDNQSYGVIRQDLFIPEKERELLDIEGDDITDDQVMTLNELERALHDYQQEEGDIVSFEDRRKELLFIFNSLRKKRLALD